MFNLISKICIPRQGSLSFCTWVKSVPYRSRAALPDFPTDQVMSFALIWACAYPIDADTGLIYGSIMSYGSVEVLTTGNYARCYLTVQLTRIYLTTAEFRARFRNGYFLFLPVLLRWITRDVYILKIGCAFVFGSRDSAASAKSAKNCQRAANTKVV